MNSTLAPRTPRSLERGFTLIEMTVVMVIFTMIVGMAITIPDIFISSKMLNGTREEMLSIRDAVLDYHRDVEAFPGSLQDLVNPTTVPSGWLGPYLEEDFSDAGGTPNAYAIDEYGKAYVFSTVSTSVRRLTSHGSNHLAGGGDDIVLDINASPVLGEQTRRELDVLNGIIATYNADFLFSNPLSTTMSTLLDQLQTANYLPTGTTVKNKYRYDAWGQEYTTLSRSPVIEIYSVGAP